MPANLIKRPGPSDRGFAHALLEAIIVMAISAVILVIGFLAWHYPQLSSATDIEPSTIYGDYLFLAHGKGKRQDKKLVVEELTKDGVAIISSRRVRFNASDYPILEYKITGRTPGTEVALYWRTLTHDRQSLFAELHWNGDFNTAYNLQNESEWKGEITELGISVTGDLRNQPISIEHLTFKPLTVKSLLLTVWSEWNAFQGWRLSSINFFRGMPFNALVSPVVAAAAWYGLAIILYALWVFLFGISDVNCPPDAEAPTKPDAYFPTGVALGCSQPKSRFSKFWYTWDIRTLIAMFLIAWLALDSKWQVNLWRQLSDTKYLFAGKTHHEQHLAADDAELYTFAKRIKEGILPKDPVRLFILHDKWQDRSRLRLMYYLLPHNIYNFGKHPNLNLLKKGDYILLLNPINGLSYSASDKMLHSNSGPPLQLDLLDQSTLGALFKSTLNN